MAKKTKQPRRTYPTIKQPHNDPTIPITHHFEQVLRNHRIPIKFPILVHGDDGLGVVRTIRIPYNHEINIEISTTTIHIRHLHPNPAPNADEIAAKPLIGHHTIDLIKPESIPEAINHVLKTARKHRPNATKTSS